VFQVVDPLLVGFGNVRQAVDEAERLGEAGAGLGSVSLSKRSSVVNRENPLLSIIALRGGPVLTYTAINALRGGYQWQQ
jgi:hypothetical protein